MEDILRRIATWEDLYSKVVDRTTPAYLELLNSMRNDYEINKDTNKCLRICDEIQDLIVNNKVECENSADYLLAMYDTRARLGDFRAYCMALEWNRPIEKQFFLPRRRILEKHGLIQAMQDVADDKLDFLFVSQSPRTGKALSNSTPILTKNGWKTHGELQVGDYVLNHKGRFVKVLATSPEYPCNCRVTFSNGEQIDCHENHEWVVYDRHGSHSNAKRILETKEMIGKLQDYHGEHKKCVNRFFIEKNQPVQGTNRKLPVDPYVLGAWIGDGTSTRGDIAQYDKDIEVVLEFEKRGYSLQHTYHDVKSHTIRYSFKGLRQDLQKIGLCYSMKKVTKYIPQVYLTSSLQQRLDLLAGLLDTDGTLDRNAKRYKFSTSNEGLKDFVKDLIYTFGWLPCVTEYDGSRCTIPSQNYWVISFNPTFEVPCHIPRKQLDAFYSHRRISIRSIDIIKNPETGKCIQVEGGIYLAGKTLMPTHNSTLGLFFLTFMAGLYPERSILGSGHSAAIIQSFFNEVLNIITSEEYRFHDIFYDTKIVNKSAEYAWIDLNTNKRFHTFSFRSIETGGTGLVEASNILYCDDLIKDIETANNPDRLDKLFYTYTSSIQDRTIMRLCKDGQYRRCPEIHIATRWSLNDVIGRLIAIYGETDSDRIRIINIPCYDENGESNFQYDYGKGFSTDYYKKLEMAEDPVVFAAKYLGQPIEREGRPFTKDQLTYYQSLPSEEPDQIVAYSDVAHGGDDYFSMPIAYVYGYDVYIEDVLFINKLGDSDTRPLVCQKLIDNNVTKAGFEENNGGKLYADFIIGDLRKLAYRCNITTHKVPTSKSKLDRILSCQSEIKGVLTDFGNYRIYFKSEEVRKDNKQYNDFMQCMYKWSQKPGSIQKTQHDDAPDSLAGLITNVLDGGRRVAKASSKFSISKLGF